MELTPETMIIALAGTIVTMALGFFKVVMKVWADFKVMHQEQMKQQDNRVKLFTEKFERIEDRQVKSLAIIIDNKEQARESKHALQTLAIKIKCQEPA